jgi:hypothetical protein
MESLSGGRAGGAVAPPPSPQPPSQPPLTGLIYHASSAHMNCAPTSGEEPGAQASCLCNTGWKPVLPNYKKPAVGAGYPAPTKSWSFSGMAKIVHDGLTIEPLLLQFQQHRGAPVIQNGDPPPPKLLRQEGGGVEAHGDGLVAAISGLKGQQGLLGPGPAEAILPEGEPADLIPVRFPGKYQAEGRIRGQGAQIHRQPAGPLRRRRSTCRNVSKGLPLGSRGNLQHRFPGDCQSAAARFWGLPGRGLEIKPAVEGGGNLPFPGHRSMAAGLAQRGIAKIRHGLPPAGFVPALKGRMIHRGLEGRCKAQVGAAEPPGIFGGMSPRAGL